MARGMLRTVLWILGGAAALWLALGLWMMPGMSRMMRAGAMMDGPMMGGGGMMAMMVMMAAQWLAMLGLAGIFLYLIVDALRERGRRRDARMEGRPLRG